MIQVLVRICVDIPFLGFLFRYLYHLELTTSNSASKEDKERLWAALVPIHLNLAACHLELKAYEEATAECDKVYSLSIGTL